MDGRFLCSGGGGVPATLVVAVVVVPMFLISFTASKREEGSGG